MPPLYLASGSPYRRALLERLQLPFAVQSADIDETPLPDERPEEMVRRLGAAKAAAVADSLSEGLVIGSDQCAVRDGEILGKPGDADTAIAQLLAASGKEVSFYTSLCVIDAGSKVRLQDMDETRVKFRDLEEDEVRRYVDIEQPLDCAGSFKAEAYGICLFNAIDSRDPTALTGLPLIALCKMLREFGASLP
ncbi:MAG: nucleoside triphosphate pyrophosphatase [Gammaproteobacteria bacterium]|nr:nucleoside triphosphate pyrophosphatase [Gammaproteobacteria bacterium]